MNSSAFAAISNPTGVVYQKPWYTQTARRHTDEPEETQNTAENFDNEDLNKQVGVCRIGESSRGTCDSDTDTTEQIACTYCYTTPEYGEPYGRYQLVFPTLSRLHRPVK